ncbi:MAG: DEAD/DEAH box helicase [Verrucomicrobiales bacterium]|nr:DEAD/DEAH box helicase [Verrucomicrobiales bacterium]
MGTPFPKLSKSNWSRDFSKAVLEKGRLLAAAGNVEDLAWDGKTELLTGTVRDFDGKAQTAGLDLLQDESGWMLIDSTCTCDSDGWCQHLVALLFAVEAARNQARILSMPAPERPVAAPVRTEIGRWLQYLSESVASAAQAEAIPSDRVVYLLRRESTGPHASIVVRTVKVRRLKDGRNSSPSNVTLSAFLKDYPARHVQAADVRVARVAQIHLGTVMTLPNPEVSLKGPAGAHILGEMLSTGRCHWNDADSPALHQGEARAGRLDWVRDEVARLWTSVLVEPPAAMIFPFEPPWYFDVGAGEAGPILVDRPAPMVRAWLNAPSLDPGEMGALGDLLKSKLGSLRLPEPKPVPTRIDREVRPVPVLRLASDRLQWWESPYSFRQVGAEGLSILVARPVVRYATHEMVCGKGQATIGAYDGKELVIIERDLRLEEKMLDRLREAGLVPVAQSLLQVRRDRHADGWTLARFEEVELSRFFDQTLPSLEAAGWKIVREPGFDLEVCRPDEWFFEATPGPVEDWFGVELGVRLGDERINLLPVLLEALRRGVGEFDPERLRNRKATEAILVPLPDGRRVPFPAGRLREIVSALVELHTLPALSARGGLEVHRLRAAQLKDLAEAPGWTWRGTAKLEALAERLKTLDRLPEVAIPEGFLATLRPYQVEGLQWLQFIREFGIGGVLADDMGLGKTIQTLAHLALEKAQGRMDRPSLVVSPTSVLVNWRDEIARFTPGLRAVVLHGGARHARFSEMKSADLVLTTYPLLPRDATELLKAEFHCVILDEAQNVKNPKTQAAQVVCQLKARHRLCLTGTPLENHLGELWSLFNFLIPGFLGDETRFSAVFRGPIEKGGDGKLRQALGRRVRPFLLRRRKDQVASELPPKSEMIQKVELSGAQRDLYETIRLSMERRVREEVASKGMNRSHIVILDALLKLRQVCCDPRLLPLESAQQVKASAKLELLMDLLPTLLEEGRRILLFSQFTSMLALIEERLRAAQISWVSLTGDTKDRATPVKRFQKGEVPLFLISLKAGGSGLNLTAADTVILYDPWWNPAVEAQATDRAHRIGQDKPVFVYRLLAEGTVEEKMLQLQERKRELVQSLLEEGAGGPAQLRPEDLEMLFSPLA